MWQDRVLDPGLLIYESGALPTALCGPALILVFVVSTGRQSLFLRCHSAKVQLHWRAVRISVDIDSYIFSSKAEQTYFRTCSCTTNTVGAEETSQIAYVSVIKIKKSVFADKKCGVIFLKPIF